jgi:hypothetical protein
MVPTHATTGTFPTAYVERMRRAFAEVNAWWKANPDKVYLAHRSDRRKPRPAATYLGDDARIHWKTAEAICGFRVDRRRAYVLHNGRVMTYLFCVADARWAGTPLVEYEDEKPVATIPQAISVAIPDHTSRRTENETRPARAERVN